MYLVELPALGPTEESPIIKHFNISSPQGSKQDSSIDQWANRPLYGPQLKLPENVAYVPKHVFWEPKEAKAAPLELMTLPDSLQQENMENYSGEGKDVASESVSTLADREGAASVEEKDMEGSGNESNFSAHFGLKLHRLLNSDVKLYSKSETSPSPSDILDVGEQTTLSQRQLVEQSTTLLYALSEPDTAKDGKEDALYVNKPTENLYSTFHLQAINESSKEGMAITTEPLIEVLTTFEVTAVELLARDPYRTDSTTRATSTENTHDSLFTDKLSVSIPWAQEEKEKSTIVPDLQQPLLVTLTPNKGSQTGVFQMTTIASGSGVSTTELESRSAEHESFNVGSHWTLFKDSKSEEIKYAETTEIKDINSPFDSLVPNWAFGLIPSGGLFL